MTRWHASSCDLPKVVVDQSSVPYCENCHVSAHQCLETLERGTASDIPTIPPDEPLSHLNLGWPDSVPWTADGENVRTESTSVENPKLPQTSNTDTPQAAPSEHVTLSSRAPQPCSQPSFIYPERLKHDQFRLICLEAESKGMPSDVVHLTLETYEDDRWPDYETVSYSWGGEDGDNTRHHPVYIGDFWDISLQTRNCFSMLQYLTPWRGVRLVWVDALCINQADITERADQVSKMGQIFSRCSQVVLWHGDDIVHPVPGTVPRRHQLHQLATKNVASTLDLKEMLKRRYFRRIWIIQELILAPRVFMPVMDQVFWADATTGKQFRRALPKSWDWNQTEAPWLQYISQGSVSASRLTEFMVLARRNQATDPRDKVFGILGLLSTSEGSKALRPDYTISFQHTFLGFAIHNILIKKEHFLLNKAATIALASEPIPSWLPDWRSADAWDHIFAGVTKKDWSWNNTDEYHHHSFKSTRLGLDRDDPYGYPNGCLRLEVGDRPVSKTNDGGTVSATVSGLFPPTNVILGAGMQKVDGKIPQNLVQFDTARLTTNLTRILAIPSTPIPVSQEAEGRYKIVVKAKAPGAWPTRNYIYLISDHPLHEVVQAGDEVWAWYSSDTSATLVILRKVAGYRAYRLVAMCYHVVFIFQISKSLYDVYGYEFFHTITIHRLQTDLRSAYDSIKAKSPENLLVKAAYPRSLYIPSSKSDTDPTSYRDSYQKDSGAIFAGRDRLFFSDLVPLYEAVIIDDNTSSFKFSPGFPWQETFLSLVDPALKPQFDGFDGGSCIITVNAEDRELVWRLTRKNPLGGPRIDSLWRRVESTQISNESISPGLIRGSQESEENSEPQLATTKTIMLRARRVVIENALLGFISSPPASYLLMSLCSLFRKFDKVEDDPRAEALTREVVPEGMNMYNRALHIHYKNRSGDDCPGIFELDGSCHMINIL